MFNPGEYDLSELRTYGRKFIVEPSGVSLTALEKKQLSKLQPAGIMLRSRNFLQDAPYPVWLEQLCRLLRDVRSVIQRQDLIVCIDHEGGRIIRPPLPITRFPYASAYSKKATVTAKAMALELKSIGVNLSFSPVADIHSNPQNPVINQRAFGETADTVYKAAIEFYRALQAEGVEGCAKHFPGHGDTSVDSHFELPFLQFELDQLRQRELIPFQGLINAGIGMVMTGHLMLPVLDAEYPATLSSAVLNNLLRGELAFKGVIISDGLGMDAIRNRLSEPEAVLQGCRAGLDLFLAAGDSISIDDALRWADVMREGVKSGPLDQVLFSQSLFRIDAFTNNLPQYDPFLLDENTVDTHNLLAGELAPEGFNITGPALNGFM